MRQALLISIWQLSAILLLIYSPLKLYQVGWGQMHIFRFLQKYLIGFKQRLWLGHSSTFTELSTIYSCCVLCVIVLLEEESSAQSAGLNVLDWVVIKDISIFWCIEIFFYSDESFSPCCWKTASYQHTLLLGWYSAGDDQRFPSNIIPSSLWLSTEAVAFSPRPQPYLPCFAPLSRERLSLHCSPN